MHRHGQCWRKAADGSRIPFAGNIIPGARINPTGRQFAASFAEPGSTARFYGDANGDRRVDVADLGLFAGTYLRASPDPLYLAYFDFNADGRVDVTDLGQFAQRYLTTLP